MTTVVYNEDCMQGMKRYPDKYFDLAIVDPPYGAGLGEGGGCGGWFTPYRDIEQRKATKVHKIGNAGDWSKNHDLKKIVSWDVAPSQEYFDDLFRVSQNQVIWGGNYFNLPPTRCFLIWRKTNVPENFSMAMCEYAWTSFNQNAKIFSFSATGQPHRFHPTQKPTELYEWILRNFAKEGDKILDTHVGSGSSRIACEKLGFDYVGFEIDKTYFDLQEQRFKESIWTIPML